MAHDSEDSSINSPVVILLTVGVLGAMVIGMGDRLGCRHIMQ
jgi:hypothetical protein